MPFRERLRKTFSRTSSTSPSETSLSLQLTNTSTIEGRKGSHIYQPGEKMPPMKYRRPVAKEHKDHLEAFDFATAWRRVSRHSIYSPHGSRMPSRNPSVVSGPPGVSRRGSVVVPPDGAEGGFEDSSVGSSSPSEGRSEAGSSDVSVSNGTETDLSSSLESWSFRDRD